MSAPLPLPIETPRLRITAHEVADARGFAEMLDESWDDLAPWLRWLKDRDRQTSVEACAEGIRYERRRTAMWWSQTDLDFKVETHSGELVGHIGLYNIDWDARKLSIGYWTRSSRRGEGIATEACNGLTRFAFGALGARGVGIGVHRENRASLRVVEKCGFVPFAIRDDSRIFVHRSPKDLPKLDVEWPNLEVSPPRDAGSSRTGQTPR